MTTSPVASISDEELNEIIYFTEGPEPDGHEVRGLTARELRGLIYRLRAAEKDAGRYRWMRDVSAKGSLGWLEFKSERTEWDTQIDTVMEKQP